MGEVFVPWLTNEATVFANDAAAVVEAHETASDEEHAEVMLVVWVLDVL